jgi:hypothetical protein
MAHSLLGLTLRDGDEALATTAAAMARAIREWTGADYGIGIAAFPPLSEEAQLSMAPRRRDVERTGTLQVALATADNVRVKGYPLASHPAIVKPRAAKQALNMLRLMILNREA